MEIFDVHSHDREYRCPCSVREGGPEYGRLGREAEWANGARQPRRAMVDLEVACELKIRVHRLKGLAVLTMT